MTKASKSAQPESDRFIVFSNAFRKHAHLLVAWGYSDTLSKIKSDNEEEPAITGYIAHSIKKRLRDGPPWCKHYFVRDDPPVEQEGCSGRKRPRVDMIIEANMKGRPEYVFEAKRLRKNGYGPSKYIGSEGMGCFITGRYASRYKESAMLGYVQSDSSDYWKAKVKAAIDKNATQLELNGLQQDITVIDDLPYEWFSVHTRQGLGSYVKIYHILLDCICRMPI
ncbi:hypothetical protein QUF90_01600 [Desulfococcaceae bacterium HSG9]|nr:hypothetical protein [Desulfococcaceae bacterium HSG9]